MGLSAQTVRSEAVIVSIGPESCPPAIGPVGYRPVNRQTTTKGGALPCGWGSRKTILILYFSSFLASDYPHTIIQPVRAVSFFHDVHSIGHQGKLTDTLS